MFNKNLSVSFVFAMLLAACSSAPLSKNISGMKAMSPDIAQTLNSAPFTGTVLPITGLYRTDAQVIKADEIVFQGSSTLEFTRLDYPFIAIEAKRIRFAAPYDTVSITRARAAGEQPKHLPVLIIRAGTVEAVGYEQNLQNFKVVVDMSGFNGSNGANGARGAHGTQGKSGRNGSDGISYCKSGAGDGKRGGRGGRGGAGNNGSDGGSGGSVQLFSDQAGLNLLTLADIRNRGGSGGNGGLGGAGGPGGKGGDGGISSTYCGRGEKGKGGPQGQAGPAGKNGKAGATGSVTSTILVNAAQPD